MAAKENALSGTWRPWPALFSGIARRIPEAIAVLDPEGEISYGDLDARSDLIARALRRQGVAPGSRVAVSMEGCIDMVAATLAILKTGASYVALDPAYPAARLVQILANSRPALVVTRGGSQYVPEGFPAFPLESAGPEVQRGKGDLPYETIPPDSPAYLTYLSSPTAEPRGAVISHGNVVAVAGALREVLGIEPHDRYLSAAHAAVSSPIRQLFLPLSRGATLVLASRGQVDDPVELLERVHSSQVSILEMAPSYWRACLEALRRLERRHCEQLSRNQVRLVVSSGERLVSAIPRAWRNEFSHPARILNLYGQTEASGACCWHQVRSADLELDGPLPIGKALPRARVLVLDERREEVPAGTPGELYVGGAGVGLGYFGNSALTAERFVNLPGFQGPFYRTGDWGRKLQDGTIEALGRLDRQVKVQGCRVELGDIESAVLAHPGVNAVSVRAPEDESGLAVIGACVTGNNVTCAGVRAYLKSRLPESMIPATLTLADETPSPCRSAEPGFAGIWRDVLKVKTLRPGDDFFALGGNSLSVARAVARIREGFGVELPVRVFFETPTLGAIESAVLALLGSREPAVLDRLAAALGESFGLRLAPPPLEARRRDDPAPLSAAQQRHWVFQQLVPAAAALSQVQVVLELTGELNRDALERTLWEIVRRHESLRTVFLAWDGEPKAHVKPPLDCGFNLETLDLLGEPEAETLADEAMEQFRRRPFDISAGPLIRALLVQLAPQWHFLMVTMHSLAADESSAAVLLREIGIVYQACSEGRPQPLPEIPIQYSDFALWQEWFLRSSANRQREYWKRQLADPPPPLRLPGNRWERQDGRGRGRTPFHLGPDLTRSLAALAQSQGVGLESLLLASFQILLSRYTGQTDLVIGYPCERRIPACKPLIGPFRDALAARADLTGNPRFVDFLRRTERLLLEAEANRHVPFEVLSQGRKNLFQAEFSWREAPLEPFRSGGVRMRPLESDSTTEGVELALRLTGRRGQLFGVFEFDQGTFEAALIQGLAIHFENLIQAIVENPGRPIESLPLLIASQRRRLSEEPNRTVAEYPALCLHQLFEEQVRRTPQALAVAQGKTRLTYQELNARANRVAHWLASQGVEAGERVTIQMERSADWIAAMLGVLKARACCVAIDPALPEERVAEILEDCRPAARLMPETIAAAAQEPRLENLDLPAQLTDPASVSYAPGPGGLRGILTPHRALVNHAHWFARHYELGGSDRVVRLAPGISPALICGAAVMLPDGGRLEPGKTFTEFLRAESVTVLELTTAFWQEWTAALSRWRSSLPGSLRLVVAEGGRASLDTLRQWEKLAGPGVLWSCHHESASYFDATRGARYEGLESVPIGRPAANMRLYVLDRNLHPAPVAAVGELHLAGDGLALGYLDRPRLTAESFPADPFSDSETGRLFRTGDLARWLPDGNLELLGKAGQQLTLGGFRVDLSEIEAALQQHPTVRQSIVTARGSGQEKKLTAYVAARLRRVCHPVSLQEHLRRRLPGYMLPVTINVLDQLPLDWSGQVDWGALPEPVFSSPLAERGERRPPRTPLEEELLPLWAKALGRDGIGVTDSFFDAGGDSLRAARLLALLRERHGPAISIGMLLQAQTVEEFAARLEHGGKGWRPGRERFPIYCVQPVPVAANRFHKLASWLCQDRPFFAIQPASLDGGRARSIEEIAARSLLELRGSQPEGPYVLAGFGLGGLVAYEMAQQLSAFGLPVRLVALLDSTCPRFFEGRRPAAWERWAGAWRSLRGHIRLWRAADPLARPEYARRQARAVRTLLWRKVWRRVHRLCVRFGRPLPGSFQDPAEAFLEACLAYRARRYQGTVAVLRAGIQPTDGCQEPDLGWGEVVSGVYAFEIPGDRETLLAEPAAGEVAEILESLLAETAERPERSGAPPVAGNAAARNEKSVAL